MSRRQLVKRVCEVMTGSDRWDCCPIILRQIILDMAREIEWLDQDNQRLHERLDQLEKK
jgi:ubiquinone biosynthesis protein UbiJ